MPVDKASKTSLATVFSSSCTSIGFAPQRPNASRLSSTEESLASHARPNVMSLAPRSNGIAQSRVFKPGLIERMKLYREFGLATVQNRLTRDTHANGDSLRKQLAYEAKKGIGPEEFDGMKPYEPKQNETLEVTWSAAGANDPAHITRVELRTTVAAGREIGQLKRGYDNQGRLRSLEARGSYGVPPGWQANDRLTVDEQGVSKLRSVFTGPQGESGKVVRRFDGKTLVLDKAYRSSLPGTFIGVPGLRRDVPTMNYMTARALRILEVNAGNLKEIKGSRVQHQLTVAHMDWLSRKYPKASPDELIYHTSWAKNINSTAGIVGHKLAKGASVVLQGSSRWNEEHPGAAVRGWDYPQQEASRLAIKHMTGVSIAHVDDPERDWRAEGQAALDRHFARLMETHGQAEGARLSDKAKKLLASVDGEQARIERRYGVDHEKGPVHMNFDVIFPTRPA